MKKVDYVLRINRVLRTLAIVIPLLLVLSLSAPAIAAPVINLSPTSGAVGTKVTVTGTNFASYIGDSISVFFDGEAIANSPLSVPPTGNFIVDFTIPGDAAPGRHSITVSNGTMSLYSAFIIPRAEIRLDVTEGITGTTVTIEGAGFYASKMVTIYYYNRTGEKLGTAVASTIGAFSYPFIVPDSLVGEHKITAENAEGNSAEAEFMVVPSITLSPTSGSPGELLTVGGNGFGYKSDVGIYFRSDEVAFAQTDAYGNFEVTFNIPEMNAGTYEVTATELETRNSLDKARFVITAGARLDKISGSIGTEIIISGSGFKAGETVTITYDSLAVATAATDSSGAFTGAFNIPLSAGGKHLITVSDGDTTKELAYSVEAMAPPVPSPLLPADTSETKAEAYFDWQDVTDASQPVTYNLQVASDQNFTSIVLEKLGLTKSELALVEEDRLAAVKKEAPYYWRVKALDSAANESEWSTPWSFYVAAPPVPALLLPDAGIKAEELTCFDWEDVSSLSPPVTYNLQVASDENFIAIVLERMELVDSVYTLTDDEKLPAVKEEAPYYWRVKALDSATNESEWSTPWPFYVGFSFALPGWVTYLLITLGVILIGFFAFWMGRRTAYYRREL